MNKNEKLSELEKAFVSYVKRHIDGRSLRLKKKLNLLQSRELLILNEPLDDEEVDSVEKVDQIPDNYYLPPDYQVVNQLDIEIAMRGLTEKEYFIIRKMFWEQESVKELCQELDVSKNTVLKTKRNALKKMKRKRPSLTSLIGQAKSGDPEALEQLYERFLPIIRKRASKMGLNYREDVKSELLAELFLVVKRFEPNTDWGKKELEQHLQKRKQ